jgi:hypothetical protein
MDIILREDECKLTDLLGAMPRIRDALSVNPSWHVRVFYQLQDGHAIQIIQHSVGGKLGVYEEVTHAARNTTMEIKLVSQQDKTNKADPLDTHPSP